MCSTSWRTLCIPKPLLQTLTMYCTSLDCTSGLPQHILHTLSPLLSVCISLYCTLQNHTLYPHPVLHTLSIYYTLSVCTAHPLLYCRSLACTAHCQPVVHTISSYYTTLARTARTTYLQPVQHTFSLQYKPSVCTAHHQPVQHTFNPHCTLSVCIPHTFSLYYTPSAYNVYINVRLFWVPIVLYSIDMTFHRMVCFADDDVLDRNSQNCTIIENRADILFIGLEFGEWDRSPSL